MLHAIVVKQSTSPQVYAYTATLWLWFIKLKGKQKREIANL